MPDPFALYERRATHVPALVGYADGYLDEEHERQVTVTRFPLETGGAIVDHAVREPDTLKLTGWTSDLYPTDPDDIAATDRPAQAWAEIDRLMAARQLVDVVTILGVYSDMTITRAIAPASTRTGRGLLFTLDLQHVQTAPLRQVEFILAPAPTSVAADRAGPVDDPTSGPTTYSPPVQEVEDTPFGGFFEDVGGIVGSTIQNVLTAIQEGDIGGAFESLGGGGQSLGTLVGDKISDVNSGLFGDES